MNSRKIMLHKFHLFVNAVCSICTFNASLVKKIRSYKQNEMARARTNDIKNSSLHCFWVLMSYSSALYILRIIQDFKIINLIYYPGVFNFAWQKSAFTK